MYCLYSGVNKRAMALYTSSFDWILAAMEVKSNFVFETSEFNYLLIHVHIAYGAGPLGSL